MTERLTLSLSGFVEEISIFHVNTNLQKEKKKSLLQKILDVLVFPMRYYRIGEGNGNPLQYSCLENPMDRGAWQAIVHGVTKSQI